LLLHVSFSNKTSQSSIVIKKEKKQKVALANSGDAHTVGSASGSCHLCLPMTQQVRSTPSWWNGMLLDAFRMLGHGCRSCISACLDA
jgi:hypothetical protein